MIRPATQDDSAAIAEIYNHYIAHSSATFEEAAVSLPEMETRINSVNSDGLPWLIWEAKSGVEAYAYARKWNPRSAYRFTVEVSIYVAPNSASKGLGTALYQDLFSALKMKDIGQAIAIITLPNEPSVALHEKMGMHKVAHLDRVGYKFERWLDVGYWQADLHPERHKST